MIQLAYEGAVVKEEGKSYPKFELKGVDLGHVQGLKRKLRLSGVGEVEEEDEGEVEIEGLGHVSEEQVRVICPNKTLKTEGGNLVIDLILSHYLLPLYQPPSPSPPTPALRKPRSNLQPLKAPHPPPRPSLHNQLPLHPIPLFLQLHPRSLLPPNETSHRQNPSFNNFPTFRVRSE